MSDLQSRVREKLSGISPDKFDNIPEEVRTGLWGLWFRASEGAKIPYSALPGFKNASGKRGLSTANKRGWTDYETVLSSYRWLKLRAADRSPSGIAKLLIATEEMSALDLDMVIEHGFPSPVAQEIIEKANTYCEVSPSGKGLRLFLKGRLPEWMPPKMALRGGGHLEAWDGTDGGRFVTVTGDVVGSSSGISAWTNTLEDYLRGLGNERPLTVSASNTRVWPKWLWKLVIATDADIEGANRRAKVMLTNLELGSTSRVLDALMTKDWANASVFNQREHEPDWSDVEAKTVSAARSYLATGQLDADPIEVREFLRLALPARSKWNETRPVTCETGQQQRVDLLTYSVGRLFCHSVATGVPAVSDAVRHTGLSTRRLSDVQPRPTRWLLPGLLPAGSVTLIAALGGVGKSCLTMDLAARVADGRNWQGNIVPQGNVLVLSGEDNAETTIRPRVEVAGGKNLDAIHLLPSTVMDIEDGRERMLAIDQDIARVRDSARELGGVQLLIIDPMTMYMSAKTDSHNDASIRAAILGPLARLAEELDMAVLVIAHYRKNADPNSPPQHKIGGSGAMVYSPRLAWAVEVDQVDNTKRILLPVKANILKSGQAHVFCIKERVAQSTGQSHPYVEWCPPVSMTAEQYYEAAAAQRRSRKANPTQVAKDWLSRQLSGGPKLATEIKRRALTEGVPMTALRDAKAMLGVVAVRQRVRKDKSDKRAGNVGKYLWQFPNNCTVALGTVADTEKLIE